MAGADCARACRVFSLGFFSILCACNNALSIDSALLYDLVILNGRVMDPATALNAIRCVGITGATIRSISETQLRGRHTLDGRGMLVAPGFIDLHQHTQDTAG